MNSLYSAAAYLKNKTSASLRLYTGDRDTTVRLPLGVLYARCGNPVSGQSAIFALSTNPKTKITTVVGKSGTELIVKSPRVSSRMKSLKLAVVPRAAGLHPTAVIWGRVGKGQALLILSSTKKWETVEVAGLSPGATIKAVVAVRQEDSTYLVIQVAARSGNMSYQSLVVPRDFL